MHVPGWYAQTKDKAQTVGIIQEQHPDRARLFMQWKQMDFPILVDSYDRYEVPFVPITLLLDEHGVVRAQASPGQGPDSHAEFFEGTFDPPGAPATEIEPAEVSFESPAPDDGWAHFRVGVAYRARHDSSARKPGDFQRAVDSWTTALQLDPNNYIWRRRIQQYGPLLDKPYPFYDWVSEAREAIKARGEQPVPLVVEPAGSELAGRTKSIRSDAAGKEPDAAGKVTRDDRFVVAEITTVPPIVAAGEAARVHVVMRPKDAHWNNEAEATAVFLAAPEGWEVDGVLKTLELPSKPASEEVRRAEFEVKAPASASGRITLPVYATYYVCEDIDGACLYRRKDLEARVDVDAG